MTTVLAIACLGFVFALVVTPVIRHAARRWGLVDRPDGHRKTHGHVTPLGGGVAVLLASIAAVCVVVAVPNPFREALRADGWNLLGLLLAALVICGVGLIDDAIKLRGRQKLLGQIFAVAVPMCMGLVIEKVALFGYEFELGLLAIPFTMFWLLGAINALNLLDGMDGLATSIALILSVTIAALTFVTNNLAEAAVALALVGALLGFLRYNFPPASIFLGDAGSMLIGLVLGILAIRGSLKGPATVALAAPMAIWAIPILDSAAAILRRKLTGRSIYTTDRAHLHHSLLNRGMSNRQTLLGISIFAACTAAGALASVYWQNELLAVFAVLAVVATLVAARLFGHIELMLVNQRLKSFGQSLLSRRKPEANDFHQSTVRLQGNREWEQVWEALKELAVRLNLVRIDLHLNAPSLNEGYFASWKRAIETDPGELWRLELPLAVAGRVVGRLEIAGVQTVDAVCFDIAQAADLLEPLEQQIIALLESDTAPVAESQQSVATSY